jgi:hypothetical protein
MQIAADTLKRLMENLVAKTWSTQNALVVFLGDYFHADDDSAMTKKSGNHLDVDGRNGKVTMWGVELAVMVVDMALQNHKHVTVKALPGNHDPKSGGDLLTLGLKMRYHNEPRVTIDTTPGVYYFTQIGNTMLGFHHGHTTKPESMPGVMAQFEPEMWGKTKYRYAFLGHFHRRIKGRDADTHGGAIWEVLQAITARDAWNRSMGHWSGRSMVSVVYSPDGGEEHREYENL